MHPEDQAILNAARKQPREKTAQQRAREDEARLLRGEVRQCRDMLPRLWELLMHPERVTGVAGCTVTELALFRYGQRSLVQWLEQQSEVRDEDG